MANKKPGNVAAIKDQALAECLRKVRESLEREIDSGFKLILFGSYARGEAGQDSDVDIMVVIDREQVDSSLKEKVRNIVYDQTIGTDYLFSVIVVSESLARERAGFKVFAAVEQEGIDI
ncbi:MAG: nucleotidyltransferase domain-containing protein [Actinobacteria bacterium]|nr:nucleotidyltransferase domain-containing protein [Actinomycetota bacterium]MCG2819047.1 nucleotidyltransferase domain-containing protein [Actinomycetes bacterium]MBU4219711.1 nucleotidyltransferase domain-containing protein [Actinomycetota bacterium]MBU4357680.1 nucleotidyltransferase domain-containing protein [Actinomycetota bacterium]MBU4391941.1 nucleotidyltransferase domain-containing protein [Actinomycetota bacterium]